MDLLPTLFNHKGCLVLMTLQATLFYPKLLFILTFVKRKTELTFKLVGVGGILMKNTTRSPFDAIKRGQL